MKKLVVAALCGTLVAAMPMAAFAADGGWEKQSSVYSYIAQEDNTGDPDVVPMTSYYVYTLGEDEQYADAYTETDIEVDGVTYYQVGVPTYLLESGAELKEYVFIRPETAGADDAAVFIGAEINGEVYVAAFYSEGSIGEYNEYNEPEEVEEKEEEEVEPDTPEPKKDASPKTGDASPVGAMAAVAVVAAGCAVVAGRKLKRS